MANIGDRVIICNENWEEQLLKGNFSKTYGTVLEKNRGGGEMVTLVLGDDGRRYAQNPLSVSFHYFFTEQEFQNRLSKIISVREAELAKFNNELNIFKSYVNAPELEHVYGKHGECLWKIDNNGTLTVSPENGISGTLENQGKLEFKAPWANHSSKIKKVVIEKGVSTNMDASYLFFGLKNCSKIDLSGLDTKKAVNMNHMFGNCPKLKSLDISKLNGENIKTMNFMFAKCDNLDYLKINGLNLPKLEDKTNILLGCNNLNSFAKRHLEQKLSDQIATNIEQGRVGKAWSPNAKQTSLSKPKDAILSER